MGKGERERRIKETRERLGEKRECKCKGDKRVRRVRRTGGGGKGEGEWEGVRGREIGGG